MPLGKGSRLGPYEIVSAIGAGGMGEVYRARDTKLSREVALKVLPEAFASDAERMGRFEREAKVLASLNHPNIASIYGFEESGGVRALVMELVEGQTLADRIANSPIPLDEALPVAMQICEGLEYAHERGIVHRDLKPANVKITPDGVVKLLDFGLAKALEGKAAATDPSSSPTLSRLATQAGIILGTAAYMAPEQAKGKAVDRRADIWAFGCVLYEMLTGKQTFGGETGSDILAAVIKEEPDWSLLPVDTPPAIRYLLRRCLKKDAKQRLRDIGDARITIDEALSGAVQEFAQFRSVPATPVRVSIWRRALPWVLLVVCSALAFALGAAYFGRGAKASRTLRLTVNPPGNGEFGTSLALSPDGTRLVFVATANGKQMLWLRSFDSLEAQPISGTENGNFPFWSPDGKSIGFFANDKLKRVDLGTGSVQSLCGVSGENSRGGSWGSDGTILFAPDITTPLMKIAAVGGTPSPATVLDTARQDKSHRWPFFLPDGRHFLFLAEHGGGAAPAIEAGSLDSTKTQLILTLREDSSAAYAAGFLLYSENGSLVGRPFDPNRSGNHRQRDTDCSGRLAGGVRRAHGLHCFFGFGGGPSGLPKQGRPCFSAHPGGPQRENTTHHRAGERILRAETLARWKESRSGNIGSRHSRGEFAVDRGRRQWRTHPAHLRQERQPPAVVVAGWTLDLFQLERHRRLQFIPQAVGRLGNTGVAAEVDGPRGP